MSAGESVGETVLAGVSRRWSITPNEMFGQIE